MCDSFPSPVFSTSQFGIVDADGALSLWQTNTTGNAPKPYLVRALSTQLLLSLSLPPRLSSPSPSRLVSLTQCHTPPSPPQTLQCHNKTAHDFVFVGSSSLIATAGLSTDNRYAGRIPTRAEYQRARSRNAALAPRRQKQSRRGGTGASPEKTGGRVIKLNCIKLPAYEMRCYF